LDRVFYRRESFLVQKSGEARAALVPLDEYRRFLRRRQLAKNRFWETTQELRQAFSDLNPKEAEDLVSQAIKAVRASNNTPQT